MAELWFWLVTWMLGTYVVLAGADLGVGVLLLLVAKTRDEVDQVLEAIRPVWKGNEVWLVACGGTLLVVFPKLLATAFSGFYLPLALVLWLLVFRNLGIELRHQVDDVLWRRFWEVAVGLGSSWLVLCFGLALGAVVRGVDLDESGRFFAPLWTDLTTLSPVGVVDWYTLLMAGAALTIMVHHGALWLALRCWGAVRERAVRVARGTMLAAFGLFALCSAASFWIQPRALVGVTQRPLGLSWPLVAVLGLLASGWLRRRQRFGVAYLASAGALYGLLFTAATAVFPEVLPGRTLDTGLHLTQAVAADSVLRSVLWWWVPGVLSVLAYSGWVYRRVIGLPPSRSDP